MSTSRQLKKVVLEGPGGADKLVLRHAAMPVPGSGQLLVEAEAAGVAFNDITTRQGLNPGRLPEVVGFDVVGRIHSAGSDVETFKPGKRVAALIGTGGYASHVLVDAARAVPVPEHLDAAEVDALVLNYATAWQMLHRVARVSPGDRILVLGAAGGVGSALRELAALDGVEVYGTSGAGRRAAVESTGAHWLADPAELPDQVDATFDPVGGPSLRMSRRNTRRNGVVVSYGFSFTAGAGYSKYGGLMRTVAALGRATVTPGPPVRVYTVEGSAAKNPADYTEDLTRLLGLLAERRIQPQVTRMPLSRAADAHRMIEARQINGKIVLVPDAG